MYGNCGFDDEKCFDDCNFPPRMGKQGVKGCKAAYFCVFVHHIGLFTKLFSVNFFWIFFF